ncbi:MAG: hypothetical protein ACREQF_08655 [Candidatus Binataceae bacterium]
MLRFAARHYTAILLLGVLGWWAMFYLPGTPSFTVLQLKRAIDARNGERAADYVDFDNVVRAAGYEMVKKRGGDPFGQVLGKGAIDLFAGAMAGVVRAWAVQRVNEGSRDVQMPAAAVVGAMVLMHRDGDTAATAFEDRDGRKWDIRMARASDGRWRISEVRNIDELLRDLQMRESRRERAR